MLLLLAGGAWPAAARLLLKEPAAVNATLRVGFGAEPRVPMSGWEDEKPTGG